MILNIFLICIIILLLLYIFYLIKQIKSVGSQVNLRLNNDSRQPIEVQLMNKHLNSLTADFNRILTKEENLRIKTKKHEEKIKNMIANISHDLRTPLTAVKGYMQLLEKSIDKKIKMKCYIHV